MQSLFYCGLVVNALVFCVECLLPNELSTRGINLCTLSVRLVISLFCLRDFSVESIVFVGSGSVASCIRIDNFSLRNLSEKIAGDDLRFFQLLGCVGITTIIVVNFHLMFAITEFLPLEFLRICLARCYRNVSALSVNFSSDGSEQLALFRYLG